MPDSNRKECVLFFVKWPEKGKVKTRLAKDMGEEHAVNLYRCFISDTAVTLKKLSQDVFFCYSPPDAESGFRSWMGDGFLYFSQADGDLGNRMRKSFVHAFECGYERAVVIGSDCPDTAQDILETAFTELERTDAVIGPAADGGYWLIGFNSGTFCPDVFEKMMWSTETVFAETMKRFGKNNIIAAVLPMRADIDNMADLIKWYQKYDSFSVHASYTVSYLKSIM